MWELIQCNGASFKECTKVVIDVRVNIWFKFLICYHTLLFKMFYIKYVHVFLYNCSNIRTLYMYNTIHVETCKIVT